MISVIICRDAGPRLWEIDTWLMSCRVLGRGVEAMVLREILAECSRPGDRHATGRLPADNAQRHGQRSL